MVAAGIVAAAGCAWPATAMCTVSAARTAASTGRGQRIRTVSGSHDATATAAAQPAGSCQEPPGTLVSSVIVRAAAVSSQSVRLP